MILSIYYFVITNISDGYTDVKMQWKMLICLPCTPEDKPKTVEGVATKLLSDWFKRKYRFGSPPQHMNYEKVLGCYHKTVLYFGKRRFSAFL